MMKINMDKNLRLTVTVFIGCLLLVAGWVVLANGEVATQLRVEGMDETVFSGAVAVGDCEVIDADGGRHNFSGVAVCALTSALSEVGVDAVFKDFGFGLFLDGIGEDITPADWSYSWSFWVNGEPASVGVGNYEVKAGDELLLAFSAYPTVPLLVDLPDVVTAGDPFDIEVSQIVGEYDESFVWQGSFEPAEGASLWVDDALFSVGATGVVEVLIDEASEIEVWAELDGKVRSKRHVVRVLAVPELTPSVFSSPSATPSISPIVSSVPSVTPLPSISPIPSLAPIVVREVAQEEREQAAIRALGYLRDNQDSDGTIGGSVVSGWSAMAFGSNSERASDVSSNDVTLWDGLSLVTLNRATDVERQIMAVRASGGDPRVWQGRNLVQDLRLYYKGGQFGEEALINDDIFGVLALLAADERINAVELRQTVENIISWQEENGSWGSVDLSAAAIQALREYKARGGDVDVNLAVERARNYLKVQQADDGGFAGNSASTAWGIQAIISLGENPNNWANLRGRTPWNAMLAYQKDNGGISWKLTDDESMFMTAYAVPALLGKAWPIQVLDMDSSLVETGQTTVQLFATPSDIEKDNLMRPSSVPEVAGASIAVETFSSDGTTSHNLRSDNVVIEEDEGVYDGAAIKEESIGKIDPTKRDFRFAFTFFGLVNMGVGVTVARLVMKI